MLRNFWLLSIVCLVAAVAVAKNETKFKSVEVKHFSTAEGVELPPEFSDFLYAEMRSDFQKKKIADQLLGEDEVVDPGDAAKSVVVQGSILEYKKGSVVKESLIGFGAGARSLTAHITLVRRSDGQKLIDKDMKVRAMARWDPKTLARFLAGEITKELKHTE